MVSRIGERFLPYHQAYDLREGVATTELCEVLIFESVEEARLDVVRTARFIRNAARKIGEE